MIILGNSDHKFQNQGYRALSGLLYHRWAFTPNFVRGYSHKAPSEPGKDVYKD